VGVDGSEVEVVVVEAGLLVVVFWLVLDGTDVIDVAGAWEVVDVAGTLEVVGFSGVVVGL